MNYPDDIHNYDNNPRSPFYEEPPTCEHCGEYLFVDYQEKTCYCLNDDCEMKGIDV